MYVTVTNGVLFSEIDIVKPSLLVLVDISVLPVWTQAAEVLTVELTKNLVSGSTAHDIDWVITRLDAAQNANVGYLGGAGPQIGKVLPCEIELVPKEKLRLFLSAAPGAAVARVGLHFRW